MSSTHLAVFSLITTFAAVGYWFSVQGRNTVVFRVLKLLHTAYGLVLGLTLLALSISTSAQPNYTYWVQWFLTNMFVLLYLWTALPFILGFFWGSWTIHPRTSNTE